MSNASHTAHAPTAQPAAPTQKWTITAAQLRRFCPGATLDLELLARDMTSRFPEYQIDTKLRVCHFMAHCAIESAYFTTLVEHSSGKQYEHNKNLGNKRPGDGPRFKGRGLLQLTGRWNYWFIGRKVHAPLEDHPEMAQLPQLAVHIACEFWKYRHCNKPCDRDDIKMSTIAVNGGLNGYDARKKYLAKAKQIWTSPGEVAVMAGDIPFSPIG